MIDAAELTGVRLSSDRTRLRVEVRDQNGETVSFSFPACWLNTMLGALPPSPMFGAVHQLASWNIDRTTAVPELILTLRTPEGQAISFALKPWQIEGMATIATYGSSSNRSGTTVH